jgi:hypothetical protein
MAARAFKVDYLLDDIFLVHDDYRLFGLLVIKLLDGLELVILNKRAT